MKRQWRKKEAKTTEGEEVSLLMPVTCNQIVTLDPTELLTMIRAGKKNQQRT